MAFPSVFPGDIDTYVSKTDGISDVMAVDVNELQSAIVAIETKLRTGISVPVHAIDSVDHTVVGRIAGQVLIATAANAFGWSGFYLTGTAGRTYTFPDTTGTVALLETTNYFTLENYVKGDKAGVMNRISDFGFTPTDHFRSGIIPTGFTWQGAPFSTPTIYYNYSGDYLLLVSNAGNQRCFLSMPITNAAANWQNKGFYARVSGRFYGGMGIRCDDGTDNNYIEFFMDASAISGMSTLKYTTRAGGGAPATTTTAYVIPSEKYAVFRLFSFYSAPNYYFYLYTVGEDGGNNTILNGYLYAFAPSAGRVGLVFNTYAAGTGVICAADWLLNSGWA